MKRTESAWYRTSEMRIVPAKNGYLQAQEQWRRDSYDIYGENSQFTTKWEPVEALPKDIDENFYSVLATIPSVLNKYYTKWKSLITYLPNKGAKDDTPESPAKRQASMRQYDRDMQKRQLEADEVLLKGTNNE